MLSPSAPQDCGDLSLLLSTQGRTTRTRTWSHANEQEQVSRQHPGSSREAIDNHARRPPIRDTTGETAQDSGQYGNQDNDQDCLLKPQRMKKFKKSLGKIAYTSARQAVVTDWDANLIEMEYSIGLRFDSLKLSRAIIRPENESSRSSAMLVLRYAQGTKLKISVRRSNPDGKKASNKTREDDEVFRVLGEGILQCLTQELPLL